MKSTKEARELARQLLRLSFTDGKLDQQKISNMVQTVVSKKPRHLADTLKDYYRLVHLEVEKRHAIVESAAPLNPQLSDDVANRLKSKYGDDVNVEFRLNSDLLGGMRIKLGDDVWDGSVRSRLQELEHKL